MARRPGEVQADIALTRQVIERELDALHRRVPKRWWLSYAWMGGGVAVGVLLSRAPLIAVMTQGIRLIQFGAALMGAITMVERVVAERSERRPALPAHGDYGSGLPNRTSEVRDHVRAR
jgi:hypothetical protein